MSSQVLAEAAPNARVVADTFRAKVEEVAAANGKPIAEVEAVLLAYLRHAAPQAAQTILLSQLVAESA